MDSMRMLRGSLLSLCLVVFVACGGRQRDVSDSGTSDSGTSDSGTSDSGTSDGGTVDSGVGDGGIVDGGIGDGGVSGPDAGPVLTLTLSPSSLSFRQFQEQTRELRVYVKVQGSVFDPVYVVLADSEGVLNPVVPITRRSKGLYEAELRTRTNLSLGRHQGAFEFRVCEEDACQRYTQVLLPYDITVLDENETHQPPLSPWTGVSDWTTSRGDATHKAHVPVQLDATRFTQRWLWHDPNHSASAIYTSVSAPISVSADRTAFITSTRSDGTRSMLFALDEADGSQRWSADLEASRASDPAVASGQVYVLTGGEPRLGHLWARRADTGATTFHEPVSLTEGSSEGPAQPLVAGERVYISFGAPPYGVAETQARDAASGAVLWSVLAGGDDGRQPASDGQRLYAFHPHSSFYEPEAGKAIGFVALDMAEGSTAFTVVDPPERPHGVNWRYTGASPVVTGNGRVLVRRDKASAFFSSAIDCIDLESQALAWRVNGNFHGVPAVSGDVFYIVNMDSSRLEARGVADGELLWSWSPPRGFYDTFWFTDLVVTNNVVFVSTDVQVYAIDVETRSAVWTYPAPGLLSLSASGLLYINRFVNKPGSTLEEGKVAAINLQ